MVDIQRRTSLLDAPAGDLVLRICGTSRNGQVVRLRSPKCAIGSGPACTLRLLARGVRPAHCLIVRGPAATVVRRWSADTLLNGRNFTDAPLAAGDRLSLGPLELEVVETGSAAPRWQQDDPMAEPSGPTAELEEERRDAAELRFSVRQAELDCREAELDACRTELDARRTELDARAARWIPVEPSSTPSRLSCSCGNPNLTRRSLS